MPLLVLCLCLFSPLVVAANQSAKMIRMSTKAFMSYRPIKKTAKELMIELQNETIGKENAKYVAFLVPYVASEIKVPLKGYDTAFFYNTKSHTISARYEIDF